MRDADICNNADIRAGYGRELAHLAEMVDAHLKNRNLVGFVHFKYSQRESAFIVKVSLCFVNIIFLCQNRSDHFFCAGLTDAAGNADHLYVKGIPVKLCNVEQRLARCFYQDIRVICIAQILMGYDAERALFDGFRNKGMRVEAFAVNCHKKKILLYLAAVDSDAGSFFVKQAAVAVINALAGFCYVCQSKIFHSCISSI